MTCHAGPCWECGEFEFELLVLKLFCILHDINKSLSCLF